MKLTAGSLNSGRWKEWYNDKVTFYFGYFHKGDVRFGVTIGNKEGSVDLFFVTFGYDRNK